MTHGTPDWGHGRQDITYSLVDDLGELAARMGGIGIYDRRGDIVWYDNFDFGTGGWTLDSAGTGGSAALTAEASKWSPFSVKLVSGSDGDRYARMINYQAPPVIGQDGLEFYINFYATFDYFDVLFQTDDVTERKRASLRFDYTNLKLYYQDVDGVWTELDDLTGAHVAFNAFASVKLVADFENNEYMRIMINRETYDMTGVSLYNFALADDCRLWTYLVLHGRAGVNDYCYVDGVILTQNEP